MLIKIENHDLTRLILPEDEIKAAVEKYRGLIQETVIDHEKIVLIQLGYSWQNEAHLLAAAYERINHWFDVFFINEHSAKTAKFTAALAREKCVGKYPTLFVQLKDISGYGALSYYASLIYKITDPGNWQPQVLKRRF